jgi:hypothetical protein
VVRWHVIKSKDSNSDGTCDVLEDAVVWYENWGDGGWLYAFAGKAGNPGGGDDPTDDLILVEVPIDPYYVVARWWVIYSNGTSAFYNGHNPVADLKITGAEAHWTGMVFGVGDFFEASDYVDFISLLGENEGGVKYYVQNRAAGNGTWTAGTQVSNSLPTTPPTYPAWWDQPTDADTDDATDNAGDDVKDAWWWATRNYWGNQPW